LSILIARFLFQEEFLMTMTKRRRFFTGLFVVAVGAAVGTVQDFTFLWVGACWLSAGLTWVLWDYIPELDLGPNFDEWAIWNYFPEKAPNPEVEATLCAGVILTLGSLGAFLLCPTLIDSWGVFATAFPGAGMILHPYVGWIKEYFLPIPLR
jgi:hypothetical protein